MNKRFSLLLVFALAFCLLLSAAPAAFAGTVDVYDVTDYGAIPNDGIDDTSAINSAISAAQSDSILHFPVGEYKVSSAITVNKKLNITGPGTIASYVGSGTQYAIKYTMTLAASGTIVDGLKFVNPSNYTCTGAIQVNAHQTIIKNCWIENFTQPLLGGNYRSGLRVEHNSIINVKGVSSEMVGDGILTFTKDSIITDNYITCATGTSGRCGIAVDINAPNSVVSNNTVLGPFRRSVHIELSPNTVVDGNTCQGATQWGIYVMDENVVVSDNVVQTPSSDGPMSGQPEVGIYLYESTNCNVSGNVIRSGGTGTGIRCSGSRNTMNNNTFTGGSNSLLDGMFVMGSNHIISGNLVHPDVVTNCGIYVYQAPNCVVSANHVEKCDSHGIHVEDSENCAVTGNVSSNNAWGGITVETGSHNAVIVGNRCFDDQASKVQDYGIIVNYSSDNVLIDGNNVSGNQLGGIFMDSSSDQTDLRGHNIGI